MDREVICRLLNEALALERIGLGAATHPQVIAAHQAAIRDFKQRLRELSGLVRPVSV